MQESLIIRNIETYNISDFSLFINGETQNLENEVEIEQEDELIIKINKSNPFKSSKIIITGYNPNVIYDSHYDPFFLLWL